MPNVPSKCFSGDRRWMLGTLGAAATAFTLPQFAQADSPPPIDVPWLDEVQTPPGRIPRENLGRFEPLLPTEPSGKTATLEDWIARRREILTAWNKFLGTMPEKRPVNRLEILNEETLENCERTLVRYEGEPGIHVEGFLLTPRGETARKLAGPNGKLPGLVGLHQTTTNSIEEIAGVKGPESMQIGLQLCRRGFVVFCPRCFLWQGTSDIRQATESFQKRRPGVLGMRKMLYDAVRGVDILASLPLVDSERIGAVGHSLGSKEAFYLAAFDERVKAAVASEGGIGFRSTNWDAPWYLGPAIRDEKFPRNHHELVALIAPRACLILAGESGSGAADGDRSWPFIEAALPIYRLYGTRSRVGIYNHRQGHSIPASAFRRMAEWLETYLPANQP